MFITTVMIRVETVMMMVSDMRIPYSGRGSPSLLGKQPDLPNVALSSKNPRFKQQRTKSNFLSQSLAGIVRWHRRASGLLTCWFVLFQFSSQTITYIQDRSNVKGLTCTLPGRGGLRASLPGHHRPCHSVQVRSGQSRIRNEVN